MKYIKVKDVFIFPFLFKRQKVYKRGKKRASFVLY